MVKRLIPLAAMEKILRKCGAERVSDKARGALKTILEEKADEIATMATRLAIHAGRKTIKGQDIKLATR